MFKCSKLHALIAKIDMKKDHHENLTKYNDNANMK